MNIDPLVVSLSGVALAAVITLFGNRKQSRAVTLFNNTEAYSRMLHDLEKRLELQEIQLNNQAQQIITLQQSNSSYLEIIKNQQEVEKELRKRISQLESEIRAMKQKYQNDKTN